ncbi:MAG: hypothetical protein RMJ16_03480 [Thermoguttaceae bacterium]|nr:hypothetical protein [Thermoguttaceae bacterium]
MVCGARRRKVVCGVVVAILPFLAAGGGEEALFAQDGLAVKPLGTSLLGKEDLPPSRRAEWLSASQDLTKRQVIAEELGEKAARIYARKQGWQPISDGTSKQLSIGPDQVWRNPATGEVIVIEAKGGSGRPIVSYGEKQGTSMWAVKSAQSVLGHKGASPNEIRAAKAVLQAAAEGKLRVQTTRLEHVLGEPTKLLLEADEVTSPQAKELARRIWAGIVGGAHRASIGGKGSSRSGAAIQPARETPGKNLLAASDVQPRPQQATLKSWEVRGGKPGLGSKVGVPAAAGSAEPLSMGAALPSQGGTRVSAPARPGEFSLNSGGTKSPVVGRIVTPAVVVVSVAGFAQEAYAVEQEYADGVITAEERSQRHAENAAGLAGGWAGSFVGGYAGAAAGALVGSFVCPGVGTVAGAWVGGLLGGIAGYHVGDTAGRQAVRGLY